MKLKKGSAAAKAYMAKIRAKRKTVKKVGAIAKTKTGKPKKRLSKAEREYNKDVDAYKYFIVWNNKVQSGWEFKNDALDALSDYDKGSAKIYTKTQLIKAGIYNPANEWKYLSGIFNVGFKNRKIREKIEAPNAKAAIKEYQNRLKPIYGKVPASWLIADKENKVGSTLKLKPNERRLGATPNDLQGKGYHKDTKSHNVNIRVISGVEDTKGVRDLMEKDIFYTVETLNRIVNNLPNLTNKAEIARHKLQIRAFKKMVEEKKKQLRALNKLINSNLK